MKKILALLLTSASLITLVSCKNNDSNNSNPTTNDFFVEEIKYSRIGEYEFELTKNISKTSSFAVANFYKETPVTKIKSKASINNTHIKSLTIGSNMRYIGDYAFKGCTNLESVELSEGTCFGEGVFEDCDKIVALEDNNLLYLGTQVTDLEEKKEYNEYYYLYKLKFNTTSYVTNINTVSIMDTFKDNKVVTSITLNSGVKYINSSAFKNSSLKNINIPSSVTYIGKNAFLGLSDININLESEISGYFTQDGEIKEEVTLTSENIKDYLTSTYVNYFFYKEA